MRAELCNEGSSGVHWSEEIELCNLWRVRTIDEQRRGKNACRCELRDEMGVAGTQKQTHHVAGFSRAATYVGGAADEFGGVEAAVGVRVGREALLNVDDEELERESVGEHHARVPLGDQVAHREQRGHFDQVRPTRTQGQKSGPKTYIYKVLEL